LRIARSGPRIAGTGEQTVGAATDQVRVPEAPSARSPADPMTALDES
jgi:hypothetical protein